MTLTWERAPDRPEGWRPGSTGEGDDRDWFFRTTVDVPEDARLVFDGIATDATVSVDGDVVAESASMWLPVALPLAAGRREVRVHCRALAPQLARPRKPRARWRTAVCDNALRFHRTTLLGRAPGFAPGPPVVGLWRPARLEIGSDPLADVTLLPRVEGADGVLDVRAPAGTTVVVAETGSLRIPGVEQWRPWTHGQPRLYDVEVRRGGRTATRRVGFRSLASEGEVPVDGVDLRLGGVPIFVRGAVWTPVPAGEERTTLETLRSLGFNAVRVAGTGAYESPAFHDACDELGMLVWQDLMFANLDAPFSVPAFRALCRREVEHQLGVVAGRPSFVVLCGSSETEQQVAMLGQDPTLAREPFFTDDVPELLAASGADALWVASAPTGAGRPFKPSEGVANWFGVGGYRRPFTDTRLAGVRFASECLAFSNLPATGDAGFVPRDVGADWDFADVRAFYTELLYGPDAPADAAALATGDTMAEVFGEWRRSASPCRGGFVLWARDRDRGAGWGLLDVDGRPKPAAGALARALAPVACWMTDEGQSGYTVHLANDGPHPVSGTLRISVYRDGRHLVAEAEAPVTVAPHSAWETDAEAVLGRWIDVSYAYRFGPPQHDLVVAAFGDLVHARFPAGRQALLTPRTAQDLGLRLAVEDGVAELAAARALLGLRIEGAADPLSLQGALLEPGRPRRLRCTGPVTVGALNLIGELA